MFDWLQGLRAWLEEPVHTNLLEELTKGGLIVRLAASFVFGCVAAAVHYFTSRRSRGADRSFLSTLVMLPVLICVVTIVIGENLARAFSLAGVLAIVRFRTVVDDTRDIAFVIFAVVAGMAVGGNYYLAPALAAIAVLIAAWAFRPAPIPKPPSHGLLILRLAAGRPADERVEEVLKKYLSDYHLIGLSTARGGSAFDASYAIQLPVADKVFALVNELGRIEGVQGVEVKDE
jgi:hypothetical protein